MAGNKRFVNNEAPTVSGLAEKREMLVSSQALFAAILSCADSRVIPNLVFALRTRGSVRCQSRGKTIRTTTSSLRLSTPSEHLGPTRVVVLGHQSCGAVTAVYEALKTNTPLPPHLSSLEHLIAPAITDVVRQRGTMDAAIEANVRAGGARRKASLVGRWPRRLSLDTSWSSEDFTSLATAKSR